MTTTSCGRPQRLVFCLLVFLTCGNVTLRSAEVAISDAQRLHAPTGRVGYITSIAFSLDDSCLVAVRTPTASPLLMQLVRFRGEYLIFELNKPEHPEVAIPLGTSSLAWVLSPPLNSPADAPRDDVLYVQGPSPIKVGWLKTKRSVASFEPAEKEAYLMGWAVPSMSWAIDGSLTRLAVVSAGVGEDEVWSSRGKAELWELSVPERKRVHRSDKVGFEDAAFSADGKVAFCGAGGDPGVNPRGEIHVWRTPDAEPLRTMTVEDVRITCLAFSPNGQTLVTGVFGRGYDARVIWWDAASGEREAELQVDLPAREPGRAFGHCIVHDCAYSPCGRVVAIAVGSWDSRSQWGEVRLIDVTTKQLVATPWAKASAWCQNVRFSHQGEVLCASNADGNIMKWKVTIESRHDN